MPNVWDFEVFKADKKLLDGYVDGAHKHDQKLLTLGQMRLSEKGIEHASDAAKELAAAPCKFSPGGHMFCAKVTAGDTDGDHRHEHAFMVLRLLHPDPNSNLKHFYVGRVFESSASIDELLEAGWSGAASHDGTFHSPI